MKSKKFLSSADWGAIWSWSIIASLALGLVIYLFATLVIFNKKYQEPMRWDASQGKRH